MQRLKKKQSDCTRYTYNYNSNNYYNTQERMEKLEQERKEREEQQKLETQRKKEEIERMAEEAERRRDEPVQEAEIVSILIL